MEFTVELWGDASVNVTLGNLPEMTMDGKPLPERIVRYLIEYGCRQSLRDAAAAETDDDKRNAKALKRLDALVNDTLREGFGGGAKLSPVEREARNIAEREVRAAFDDPDNQQWIVTQRKETGLGISDLRTKATKAHLEAHRARLMKAAEEAIALQDAVKVKLAI